MKSTYVLALLIAMNIGVVCASELSEYDEEVMEIHQENQLSQNEKILRIVQMVSGVLGIMEGFHGSHKTLVTSASDARRKFYVRGAISLVSFLNGFITLHRGFVGEDLRPEDTGLVKKVIAFLGLLSLKPFTTLNGATILWESFA